ncbi:MAG: DeoR/GlpR family DNA-binding transcription regulator [Anaerolineae bacterium]|nr:DeoR/GlpR family DNA-binding transcription regulator [Anaerolineae bacterium]
MLKRERQHFILDQLREFGVVRVSDLTSEIQVDPGTIRRDLTQLEQEGRLHRVHGGAVLQEQVFPNTPADQSTQSIAEAAAKFIPNSSVIFLGPGSITAALVPFLQKHTHLTIVTNALDAAWRLCKPFTHTLHIIGGQVSADFGIYGGLDALNNMRFDWIILEAFGLDAEKGLTVENRGYAEIARELFKLSAQTLIVIAPERIGKAGALFIAPASEVDILITGREAPNPSLWDLSELGIRIVLA